MPTREEEKLARQNVGRIRAANAAAEQRAREEAARARALSRGNRTRGKARGGDSSNSGAGKTGGKPFRLRFHTRSSTKAGPRHSFTRTPKAPPAISHFRFQRKYSNRAGAHGSPTSAVGKLKYDTDNFTDDPNSRVKSNIVYASAGTPRQALDPLRMAEQCEATAGRQVNSRQMAHDTVSLPKELTDVQRERLALKIAERISAAMDGVPVYASIHEPDGKNHNHHVHMSAPLRHVVDDGDGRFHLGERVAFEQRPTWREGHGLEKTNHNDLKTLRANIAWACADALKDAGVDHHVVERWRYGYLRLNGEGDTQTTRARERGDTAFVQQNEFRETQKHEGPGRRRDGEPTPSQGHNDTLEQDMAPRVLAGKILSDSISEAKSVKAQSWEQLREIAARKGLTIDFVRRRHKNGSLGKVTGWKVSVAGSTVSGQQAGMTFRAASKDLEAAGLKWANIPPDFTPPPAIKAEKGALTKAVQDLHRDATPQAVADGAQQAKPAKYQRSGPLPAVPPGAAPQVNKVDTVHIMKEKKMDVSAMFNDLQTLPGDDRSAIDIANAKVQPKIDVARPAPPLLNDAQKSLMRALFPRQDLIRKMDQSIARLQDEIQAHVSSEPPKRTWLGSHKPHDKWIEQKEILDQKLLDQQRKNATWTDKYIYSNPTMIDAMDKAVQSDKTLNDSLIRDGYSRALRISESQGPAGARARKRLAALELEHPQIIGPMKEAEAKRKAAQAETKRLADKHGSKTKHKIPGSTEKPI